MLRRRRALVVSLLLATAGPQAAFSQVRPDPAALAEAQKQAMSRLAFMDGVWRGPAWTVTPAGEKHEIVQTERIGPFLDGAVKVIEGRGFEGAGVTAFNALAVVSFDPGTQSYNMRSYAQGQVGDFTLTVTPDGFVWEIPAGPMTIRYTAVFKDGSWREVGDRIGPDGEPVRFFEMTLIRVGDTGWPAAGGVPMR